MIGICMTDKFGAMDSNGKQPIHLQKDLDRFKKFTEGNIVVMGRKTLEDLPGGRSLRNRINIVLTRNRELQNDPGQNLYYVCNAIEMYKCINEIHVHKGYPNAKAIVIGGPCVLNEMIERGFLELVFVTRVNIEFPNPTNHLIDLDSAPGWYRVPSLAHNFMKDYDKSTGDSFNTEVVTYVRS